LVGEVTFSVLIGFYRSPVSGRDLGDYTSLPEKVKGSKRTIYGFLKAESEEEFGGLGGGAALGCSVATFHTPQTPFLRKPSRLLWW
jgi:hypothetical protein